MALDETDLEHATLRSVKNEQCKTDRPQSKSKRNRLESFGERRRGDGVSRRRDLEEDTRRVYLFRDLVFPDICTVYRPCPPRDLCLVEKRGARFVSRVSVRTFRDTFRNGEERFLVNNDYMNSVARRFIIASDDGSLRTYPYVRACSRIRLFRTEFVVEKSNYFHSADRTSYNMYTHTHIYIYDVTYEVRARKFSNKIFHFRKVTHIHSYTYMWYEVRGATDECSKPNTIRNVSCLLLKPKTR